MKKYHVALFILLILTIDQALKIYIKTNYHYGESREVLGQKFQLLFTENVGMAYGWTFGGNWGKLILTVFRMIAVVFGTFLLGRFVQQKFHKGFIICAALIYAGALGNLIDSMFYGMWFDKGMYRDVVTAQLMGYDGIAQFSNKGYSSFLHGNVVDMLYFPLFEGTFPKWVPYWGGQPFTFFNAIFNIADAAISTGVFSIFIFQKRFFGNKNDEKGQRTVETQAVVNDEAQVL